MAQRTWLVVAVGGLAALAGTVSACGSNATPSASVGAHTSTTGCPSTTAFDSSVKQPVVSMKAGPPLDSDVTTTSIPPAVIARVRERVRTSTFAHEFTGLPASALRMQSVMPAGRGYGVSVGLPGPTKVPAIHPAPKGMGPPMIDVTGVWFYTDARGNPTAATGQDGKLDPAYPPPPIVDCSGHD